MANPPFTIRYVADAIVIGSGPNGLVAANMLADRGWSVAVFEGQPVAGGAVKSGELLEPGYVNDLFSAFYPLAAASPVFARLGLHDYGLTWRRSPLALAHPGPDGTCPAVSMDLAETVRSLEKTQPGDGDAWRALFERFDRVRDALIGSITSPFPPVRAGLKMATSMSPADLLRFSRFAVMPARRLVEEEFTGEPARRLLTGNALHADFAPESTLSGFFGWFMMCLAQWVGFPVPEGGSGKLTEALVKRLAARGGTVTCSAPVVEVIVRRGRAVGIKLADGTEVDATRAVVADVAAPFLYRHLIGEEHLPAALLDDIQQFHWDSATVKVDWTLDGPIPWNDEDARRAGTVHIGDSVDAFTMWAAQMATGTLPEHPVLIMGQQSMTDPTRQPAGKETAWAYTHVPHDVKADAGGALTGSWNAQETEAFADRVELEIERLAPGFRALIRRRHVFTPNSFEAANANLAGGALGGGTAQLHQQLVFRPVPGLGRANTPIAGLYLGSSSAHPGGGVHGAPGANAARAAIAMDRVRRVNPFAS